MTRCCNLGHLTVSRYPPPRWFRFRRRVSNSWKRILENTFRRITMKVLTMQLNSTSVMDIVAYGGAAIGMAVAVSEFLKGNISVAGTLCIVLLASEFFLPLRLLDGVKYATNILLQESENGLVFILILADFFPQIFPYIFTIFYILRRVHKEYKAICYDKRKKR